jgi:hypothetical protein
MFDILQLIPGKKKIASKGWYSFNAVCCHHNGHRADDRGRAGITFDSDDSWTYHCFNCGFSTRFTLGKQFSYKLRELLSWCGVDHDQITKWSFESLRQRRIIDVISTYKPKWKIKFDEVPLPNHAVPLDPLNPDHAKYVDYLASRGYKAEDFSFMVSPDDSARNSNRIIIPYTFDGKPVGYISRYLDNRIPKYIKNQQVGYVFGYDQQRLDNEVCLVFEGVLDAISLNGCAITHDSISDEQADVLRRLRRRIIVVPDQDKTGLEIIDRALELGFHVALPDWGQGVKDANDAVVKYGKLPTLLSILQAATNSKIKIQIARTKLDKRI